MTQPSKVLDAVVAGLAAEISGFAVVRPIAGVFGGDLKDLKSLPAPSVHVACVRMPLIAEYENMWADGRWMAICIARAGSIIEERAEDTPDDAAMNLAALVMDVVRDQTWDGLCVQRPRDLVATNQFTPELQQKGLRVWLVQWAQPFEYTRLDAVSVLRPLSSIHYTAEMGGADVGDQRATVELEGAEV